MLKPADGRDRAEARQGGVEVAGSALARVADALDRGLPGAGSFLLAYLPKKPLTSALTSTPKQASMSPQTACVIAWHQNGADADIEQPPKKLVHQNMRNNRLARPGR
jgi:hypothetical protein